MKLGLQELPSDFFQQYKDLEELELEVNNLVTLPPEIGQLQNLQKFWLEAKSITALPPEIGQLQNLQMLALWCPKITTLPPEIGALKNLQCLALSSLRDLGFGGNHFTELPAEIGQLQKLQRLWLSDNLLTALPPEIEQLQNLEEISLTNNPIQDLSALANHPNQKLKVRAFGVELSRQYWTHLSQWKAEWLLTENNAELRRVLIQQIGYDRICEELQTIKLDSWREYTLLKIDVRVDDEPIHLLKMTCPSTNHIHVLRVPPDLTSAREAISWANWDIDPEAFAAET